LNKKELLKECVKIMATPKVEKWYTENLETKSQKETIDTLIQAYNKGELTLREALSIALIVGYQWNVKFEGVP
jgi:hypothetical protein